jgi:RND family efflux transporter MFP subunit
MSEPMFLRPLLPAILLLGQVPVLSAVQVEGTTLPFRQVEVSPAVSSRILELKVKEGDVVKEGQALAILYGRLEELEMQRAKALLERREFEAKGAKRLYENKIIPESKALETRIDLDLARLQYETAAEQVRLRTIVAPISGMVVSTTRDVGEAVATAQPLFRILDLSKVVVQISVDPDQLKLFHLGAKPRVRFRQSNGGSDYQGLVVLVDPCADAIGKVRVKVQVENPDGKIRSGLKAWVEPAP